MPLDAVLAEALGGRWRVTPMETGVARAAWRAEGSARLFVKTAGAEGAPLLAAEAEGLRAIAATRTIRVPQVALERDGLLALEWLDLAPGDGERFGEAFGEALAALHAAPAGGRFGWPRDNFVGMTPQVNTPHEDWVGFWRESRLLPMLARLKPLRSELREAVLRAADAAPKCFDDGYVPGPSLIHGDLWSGNWGRLRDGTPVIFDPCVSSSDREAELAMMELFGAPPAGFWRAYAGAAGLAPGYPRRKRLYQLYHLLNHAVLFGGAYEQQALACARACATANPH